MFTDQELQQLVYFLNKSTLIGQESLAHAQLLIKVQNLIRKEEASNEQE